MRRRGRPAVLEHVEFPDKMAATLRPTSRLRMASIHETFSRVSKGAIAAVFLVWKLSQTALFRLAGRPITATFVVLAYRSVKSWERERFTRQMDCLVRVAKVVKADFTADKTGQE